MVSPGEVSARNHVFKLNEKVFVEKEGRYKLEELILVEYSLDIAEKGFHHIIEGSIINNVES
jgi:Zn-dependent alcohol dehydrogenase